MVGPWFNRNAPLLSVWVFFGAMAALYFLSPTWSDKDLNVNLFAGAIGTAFTVTVVDRLLKRNERRRSLAPRFGAYIESCRILGEICGLWAEMVKVSLADPPPPNSDLFSQHFVDIVSNHLALKSVREGGQPMVWHDYIANTMTNGVTTRIAQVLQRYSAHMDSELIEVLIRVENAPTVMIWSNLQRIISLVPFNHDALPKIDSAIEDFDVFKQLGTILKTLAPEFKNIDGFFAPYDFSFGTAVEAMRTRDDIVPKLGTSRREDPGKAATVRTSW